MSIPHYHTQPATLDPNAEPPENPPLAQGHDDAAAGEVAEAQEAHRQAVADAAESPVVGPRAPGDHAGDAEPDDEPRDERPVERDERPAEGPAEGPAPRAPRAKKTD
jgi:hypothetical protein